MQNQSRNSQSSNSSKKMKSQGRASDRAMTDAFLDSKLGSALNERAPEFIQDVVQYLDTNWGLGKIEKVAAALGVGSTLDLDRIKEMANWETIKRKVTARPAQTAALVVAGIGMIVLARQLIADQDLFSSSEKSGARARH